MGCRLTLCNETVVQFIHSSNMLVWACNMNSGEGYRASQNLQPQASPSVAVIMLKDNRMTIVARSVLCLKINTKLLLRKNIPTIYVNKM